MLLIASNYVLCPTTPELLSLDGLSSSLAHLQRTRKLKTIDLLGIVPNQVRAQTLEHAHNLEVLHREFGDKVWDAIPDSIVWPEASSFRIAVFTYAPDHQASQSLWKLVERIETSCPELSAKNTSAILPS